MSQFSRWTALLWLLLGLIVRPANSQSLSTRGSTLRAVRIDKSGLGFEINFSEQRFVQLAPLVIETVDSNGQAQWVKGNYSSWKATGKTLRAEGTLLSSHRTRFLFRDTYQSDATGFQLERRVEVASPHPQDAGFSSRFGVAWAKPLKVSAGDAIMPGVWYRDNKSIPPKAFPVDLDEEVMMLREDRLGLPLVGFRDRESGIPLTMQRVGGQPTTFAGDTGRERRIDRRMQTGALGFLHDGQFEQAFSFPGTEDERSSNAPDSLPGPRYLPRSHPVEAGFVQDYTLHFEVRRSSSFAEFMEGTMKASLALANPPLLRADLTQAYRASQDLLSTVIQPYNGTVAVPFYASLPHGEIKDTSTQMGFVGMALPCTALLLKDGLESKNADAIARAEKVIGFWVEQAATPSGNPKTWADFPAPGKVIWRDYPTNLRVASDGLEGVLQAWSIARRHGMDRPQWLEFAQRYGDFLAEKQNEDGSWFGSWNIDGTPHDRFTNATTHPIEFLIDLSSATGNPKYRDAALKAGEFCWRTVHQVYSYVGGTPDNPNVTDKEAGVMAVRAFLALFDATGNRQWLDAAKQSALFCESWVYWRELPIPEGDDKQVFPLGRSTVGISLISTGHSGADNYMAMAPFWWYRIYLATGDSHFMRTARLLLHDTKQVMDYDGKAGYKYPGQMPEAMDLSTNRGQGVAGWLPWLTFVTLDPMRRLQEAFGSFDIDVVEKLPLAKRSEASARFGKTRGF